MLPSEFELLRESDHPPRFTPSKTPIGNPQVSLHHPVRSLNQKQAEQFRGNASCRQRLIDAHGKNFFSVFSRFPQTAA
jgi:hypothetical protein